VLVQLDKILLSRMLDLADFGRYALAGVVAGALQVLLAPMFSVIYPRMTALVATGATDYLLEHYRFGTQLLAAMLFPLAIGISLFAADLLFVWTGNLDVATKVAPIVSVMIIGTALNGIMIFPFALQLAHARTDIALAICVGLACILVPLIVVLTGRLGAVGGALAWLVLNVLYVLVGSQVTNRKLFAGRRFPWLAHDVGLPLLCSAAIVCPGAWLWHAGPPGPFNVVIAAVLMLLALTVNALLLPRTIVRRLLRGQLGEA
jgi:O-antigen/teichoic acid export membrane protein